MRTACASLPEEEIVLDEHPAGSPQRHLEARIMAFARLTRMTAGRHLTNAEASDFIVAYDVRSDLTNAVRTILTGRNAGAGSVA